MAKCKVAGVWLAVGRSTRVRWAALCVLGGGSLLATTLACGIARADETNKPVKEQPVKEQPAKEQPAKKAVDKKAVEVKAADNKAVDEKAVAVVHERDGTTQTFTLESIENPAPRKLEFKVIPVNRPIGPSAMGQSMFQHKFVVSIRIQSRARTAVRYTWMREAVYSAASFGDRTIFGTPTYSRSRSTPYEAQWPGKFAAIVNQVPVDERPPQEVIDFFTNPRLSRVEFDQMASGLNITLRFGVESAEQGETLAKGLLKLLDWGVSRPLQLMVWRQREEHLAERATAQQAVDKATQKLGPHVTVLASLNEAPTAKLVDLTVTRVGVEARIQSLSKHPVAAGLEKNLLEAQAELAEIDAQINLLNDLNVYRAARMDLRRVDSLLREDTEALAIFAPITIEDGPIVILEPGKS